MRRVLLSLLFAALAAVPAFAQTTVATPVSQSTPGTTSDAAAWPIKVVFGGVQVDPRDVGDRAARLLGKVTFNGTQDINVTNATLAVTGTFWQATQPVSNGGTFAVQAAESGTWNITNVSGTVSLPTGAATAAKQPALGTAGTASTDVLTIQGITSMTKLLVTPDLPSGASTAAKQPALGTAGTASTDVLSVQGIASGTALGVSNGGTFAVQAAESGTWNVTNVSGTVSLPTGASTAAKQPALGTAGTASSDVISVQGVSSMTALVVDGSGVTQPVSGTVTAARPTVATATLANVAASGTVVTLLASNTSRKGVVVYNDSTANLFLKYGATASLTSFTYFLGPGQSWEMPAGITYTGIITGIWSSATGTARVTEL